ncbi:hypothetical protein IAU60_001074 [Kwoniella sp. DSM 27419]
MSYRPRSRSRSPDYRARRYSPSRPASPNRADLPPRPAHTQTYSGRRSPPRGGYGDYPPPPRGYDDYPPPPRRYEVDYPPPPRRYEEEYRPRERYDDRRPYDGYERYPTPPRPQEYEARGRYEDRDRPYHGMVADREEQRPRRDGGGSEPAWERGRDADELRDQPGSNRRQKAPGVPSQDVIFLGLDPELSETDLNGYLRTEHKVTVSSVKIVKDKVTGKSKGFGFAQFSSVSDAEEFISINYPAVLMPALYAHSDPRKVKIDFAIPTAQSNPHGETSHSSYASGPNYARPAHDGMRDIGTPGDGKRVLLLRGLDSGTSGEEVITRMSQEVARMLGKSGREAEAENTIVRMVLVIDRDAHSSWGYGFVELATAELASAMLPFLLSPQHQPNGFLINHVPVAASFADPSAFIASSAGPLSGELVVRPTRSGGIGSELLDQPAGQWCTYWHQLAGLTEVVSRGAPRINENGDIELTPDHRAFLGTLAGVPVQGRASTQSAGITQPMAPINIAGGLQPIKIGTGSKGRKKEEIAMIPISGKNLLGDEEEEVDLVGKDTVLLSRTKGIHIIPPTSSSRKIAKNISKWNTKQSELAAPEPVADPNGPPKGVSDVNLTLGVKRDYGATTGQQSSGPSEAGPSKSPRPTAGDFDYTDVSTLAVTGKVACLLCQRQFKTEEVLKKHVAQSDLHKSNLADGNACDAGRRRKLAVAPSDPSVPTATYRDRAAERRTVFHQSNVPLPEEAPSFASQQEKKRKYAEGPKPPAPPPLPSLEPGKDDSNVGNQLLAKMGWRSGTGLGKEGEGRVDPVLVQQFENRAGLGASKGVEAGRWQGPGGFQQRALDMAKARYDSTTGST